MKRFTSILALTAAILCTVTTPASAVPVFNSGNGHHYDVIVTSISWNNARTQAGTLFFNGIQGHLATITSASEQNFINTFLTAPIIIPGNLTPWLGGFQTDKLAEPAGNWAWVTGETFSFTNWGPGEPNNSGNIEDKMHMNPNASGFWNDHSGLPLNSYVVEYDTPEPATLMMLGLGLIGVGFSRRRAT